jgi:energy-coupling factor transport system ATP-binding protein
MIVLEQVSYWYEVGKESIPALNDISFTIQEGEFLAILGPNGSGKSTLARHLNGLLQPREGKVKVDGLSTLDDKSIWQIREKVTLVFQNPDNQIIGTLVEEDIAFGPENLGLPQSEIRKRVEEALSAVGITAYAKREPHFLSGGEKQLVAIAGALALKPKYLVLDEPTSMLDPAERSRLLAVLKSINRRHKISIILITHEALEAVLADRILVLYQGRIALEGTPYEILTNEQKLSNLGVRAPQMTILTSHLFKLGIQLRRKPITPDEMIEELCLLN